VHFAAKEFNFRQDGYLKYEMYDSTNQGSTQKRDAAVLRLLKNENFKNTKLVHTIIWKFYMIYPVAEISH
jgi:hypothetical protein